MHNKSGRPIQLLLINEEGALKIDFDLTIVTCKYIV